MRIEVGPLIYSIPYIIDDFQQQITNLCKYSTTFDESSVAKVEGETHSG